MLKYVYLTKLYPCYEGPDDCSQSAFLLIDFPTPTFCQPQRISQNLIIKKTPPKTHMQVTVSISIPSTNISQGSFLFGVPMDGFRRLPHLPKIVVDSARGSVASCVNWSLCCFLAGRRVNTHCCANPWFKTETWFLWVQGSSSPGLMLHGDNRGNKLPPCHWSLPRPLNVQMAVEEFC